MKVLDRDELDTIERFLYGEYFSAARVRYRPILDYYWKHPVAGKKFAKAI